MYLQYDEELLFEDVNFPLRLIDDIIYDKADNAIADKIDDDVAHKMSGEFKEVEDVNSRFELNEAGEFIDNKTNVVVGRIIGWSRLRDKGQPQKRQDNIANYLINRLNAR